MIQLPEFELLLTRHGADLEHWPETERQDAKALLASDTAARAALDQERGLASLFGPAPPAPDADWIVSAITSRPRPPRPSVILRWFGPGASLFGGLRVGILAFCLVLGLVAGALQPHQPSEHEGDLTLLDGSGLDLGDD